MKFIDILWGMIAAGLFIWCSGSYFSTPVVYWSASANKCVKIVYNGVEKDCSEWPEKYSRVWVK